MRFTVIVEVVPRPRPPGAYIRESFTRYFLHERRLLRAPGQDGLEAVDLLGEVRVDLVVSDLKMPRMDGIALAQHIRSRVPGKTIRR